MNTQYIESAFPLKEPLNSDESGMTLLDYFAAKAMNAEIGVMENGIPVSSDGIRSIAEESYKMAAAMIEARKKYID